MYFPGIIYLLHGYPPEVPNRYLRSISIIALVCASVGVASAAFGSTAIKKGTRVAAYMILAACSLVPLSQVWKERIHDPVFKLTVLRYGGCFLVALYGALLYAAGIPERFRPGRFDMFGASHQIFHVCVLLCFYMFHLSNFHLWVVLSSQGLLEGVLEGHLHMLDVQAPEIGVATALQQ